MTTIKRILSQKGSDVYVVGPEDTVLRAIRLMAEKDIGSLVVVEDERPIGIFTERHYARNVFLRGRSSPDTVVRDAMAVRPVFARPELTVQECMAIMTTDKVRHLPVLERDKLVGVVSIGDLVRSTITDQEFSIRQLEDYIRS